MICARTIGARRKVAIRMACTSVYVSLAALTFSCGEQTSSYEPSSERTGREPSAAAASISASPDTEEMQSQSPELQSSGSRAEQERVQEFPLDAQQGLSEEAINGGQGRADAGNPATPDAAEMLAPLPENITVWIAGDSTVSNGNTPCPRGWGGEFEPLFDDRVRVVNGAAGGRSVRTWLYEVGDDFDAEGECELGRNASGGLILQDRWQRILDGMSPGDYLLIQFGINDGDPSCDRHVGLDAFVDSYEMMADAAKQRGAQPVFITPASMIRCSGATPVGSRGGFVPATLEAGQQFDVPVIDLHALSVELYTQLEFCPVAGGDVSAETTGPVGEFFCDDHTHFDRPGAERIAELMAAAIASSGISLAGYLR